MISSLAFFRPPTIPQYPHQEVAAPVQQSGEVEANEEELEFVLCAKSWCVPDLLHLECLGTYAAYIHILVHGFADSSRKPESQSLFSQHLWKQLQAWNLLLRS